MARGEEQGVGVDGSVATQEASTSKFEGAGNADITIRPIAPGDAGRLRRFHGRLSSETVYLRFFSPHPQLSSREVDYFTHVDHQVREAVVASAGNEVVGVARFDCLPGTSDAEIAVVVEDAWQGRGVGSALLRRLTELATGVGVRRFVAEILAGNHRMLRLVNKVAPASVEFLDGCVVRAVVSLETSPPPGGEENKTMKDVEVEVDRNGLEVLGREECLRLLGSAVIGRLGLSSGALPVVLPVNFLLDDDRILIRTSPGTKLDRALAGAVVAFEVDDVEPFGHSGWSVLVTGTATTVDDAEELSRIQRLPLAHWAPGAAEHVVAISVELVTGRRIRGFRCAAGVA